MAEATNVRICNGAYEAFTDLGEMAACVRQQGLATKGTRRIGCPGGERPESNSADLAQRNEGRGGAVLADAR